MSGSQSLVSKVTGTAGVYGVGGGWMFWAASVWASKAMAAAKSPPVLGSGADMVFVAAEGSSAIGSVGLAQVKGILKASQ